jgi:hypothetical protein
MTMMVGLGIGPPIAIVLAVATYFVQYNLRRSNKIKFLRVVSLVHHFLFVAIVIFFVSSILFLVINNPQIFL